MRATGGQCALAGTVGAQLHVAAAIGADKRVPGAQSLEFVLDEARCTPKRCEARDRRVLLAALAHLAA
ncbi:MAG: hypothetical protein IT376_16330 [Polyangiaceae bacterium]|nr:hypothetical protein [Polyangiaceae bacterium]